VKVAATTDMSKLPLNSITKQLVNPSCHTDLQTQTSSALDSTVTLIFDLIPDHIRSTVDRIGAGLFL